MGWIKAASIFILSVTCQSPVIAQDLATLLSGFVSGSNRTEREQTLLKLSEHHPEAGPALLKVAIETTDTETQWLAIRGLGWLKYTGAAPFLKESLHSNSNYLRANSARALGELHDVSAVPVLTYTLAVDEDDGVLQQTSVALEMLDAKESIPVLEARATSQSPDTRLWIIGAVEALGSKNVSFFAHFLFDENEFVASYAAHAIARITKQDFGFPHCGSQGPCSEGHGVENARDWWNSHKPNRRSD